MIYPIAPMPRPFVGEDACRDCGGPVHPTKGAKRTAPKVWCPNCRVTWWYCAGCCLRMVKARLNEPRDLKIHHFPIRVNVHRCIECKLVVDPIWRWGYDPEAPKRT